jgi:hypothetical protein
VLFALPMVGPLMRRFRHRPPERAGA